jgi:hypothetical protein
MKHLWWLVLLMSASLAVQAESRFVRDGSFNQKGGVKPYFTQETVEGLRKQGWTCPDAESWPAWWSGIGPNMKLAWSPTGGKNNDAYVHLAGKQGILTGYHGLALKDIEIKTFWARGTATVFSGFLGYGTSADGSAYGGLNVPGLTVKVNSPEWVRYRHVLYKSRELTSIHVAFNVPEGEVDLDEVDVEPATPALALMVEEENGLYGQGVLIENKKWAEVDVDFKQKASEYAAAVKRLRENPENISPSLLDSINQQTESLDPYVLTKGLKKTPASRYNDMIALTRVCNNLAPIDPVTVEHAAAADTDTWTFHTPGGANPVLAFKAGNWPGFKSPQGSNTAWWLWYCGNGGCIMPIINGEYPKLGTPEVTVRDGQYGAVTQVWTLANDAKLSMTFTVPGDGHAIYTKVDLTPGTVEIKTFSLQLPNFPGGILKQPAEFHVTAPSQSVSFTGSEAWKTVTLTDKDYWVFYDGDAPNSRGWLGLVYEPKNVSAARVEIGKWSNIATNTFLDIPVAERQARFALYAYPYGADRLPATLAQFTDAAEHELAVLNRIYATK